MHFRAQPKWPVSLMDKASASGARDSRFESWVGHRCSFFFYIKLCRYLLSIKKPCVCFGRSVSDAACRSVSDAACRSVGDARRDARRMRFEGFDELRNLKEFECVCLLLLVFSIVYHYAAVAYYVLLIFSIHSIIIYYRLSGQLA